MRLRSRLRRKKTTKCDDATSACGGGDSVIGITYWSRLVGPKASASEVEYFVVTCC